MSREETSLNRKYLANFTLSDQTPWLDLWDRFGYRVDPVPRGLLVDEWTDDGETILSRVRSAVSELAACGFEALLIGGAADVMSQAAVRAWELGLEVVVAAFSPQHTPDGGMQFSLVGIRSVPPPYDLWVWKTRPCERSLSG